MNSKALVTFFAFFMAASMSIVSADDWHYSNGGEFQSCPTGKYATGLCGADHNNHCYNDADGKNYKDAIQCEDFPVQTDSDFQYNAGSWSCYDSGHDASCGTNEVMTGICGSGEDPQCMSQCGNDKNEKSSFAIRCAPIAQDIILDDGEWEDPQKEGTKYSCPSGKVACGACFSNKDPKCQGDSFRAKCCTPSEPFNITGNLGWWQYVHTIDTSESDTITVGITNQQSHTETTEWSTSVTESVGASLTVEGVGGITTSLSETQSQSVADTQKESWTKTGTYQQEIDFDQSQVGYVLWQWHTAVTDNRGCDSFEDCSAGSEDYAVTDDAATPPKCLPGYMYDHDTSYQTCDDGMYLPGYEPSSRNLRGGK